MRIVVLAAAVGLLVHTGGIATGEPPEPRTHTVTIDGFRFQPERLTVARGDRIVWVNKDVVPHTATSRAVFDSQTILVGKSWTLTATKKGEFAYRCTLHPAMKGSLNVE